MSADSLRSKHVSNRVLIPSSTGLAQPCRSQQDRSLSGSSGHVVRPQAVSEKTLMESVAGLINEVGLVPQPYSTNEEKENNIVWTKFESIKPNFDLNWNLRNLSEGTTENTTVLAHCHPPLLLTLAYPSGLQMWAVAVSGEAQEVLSWRRPAVRLSKLLPSPATSPDLVARDHHRESRPIVAIVEGFVSPSSPNHLTFISLRTGEILKNTKFIHPVCDLLANSIAIVLSFLDKILILDPFTFDTKRTIACSSGSSVSTPLLNSIALGSSWLAYSDRKLVSHYQSIGGVEPTGVASYTATVIYAAKSLTKGLKGLGESVANSITGHRNHVTTDQAGSVVEPGVVTVLNLGELKSPDDLAVGEVSPYPNEIPHSAYIAHFVAHTNHPVHAMRFDPSGLLLVTADREGHDFHVFRIHPHPLGPNMAAVHHLYILHRGDTGAKVQDISFAHDSRWVAVSTLRGTTHIFPITPYGGAISVRTHISHRVVNRLSRFHRTAGLDDTPASGRNSPVLSFSPGGTTTNISPVGGKSYDLFHLGSPYPNPRLPPFPHPLIINPLAQLRQNFNFPSSSPKSSPPIGKSKGLLTEERVHVASNFEEPRGWLMNTPGVIPHCDKRKKSPVEAVYVMTCHGHLIEYYLEPKQASGTSKEKVSDDTAIELVVHARAQWNFTRPSFSKELHPPLSPNNLALLRGSFLQSAALSPLKPCVTKKALSGTGGICSGGNARNPAPEIRKKGPTEDSADERWLSHVEITTHSGPHRRLWMGPQFTFKVFNPSTMSSGNQTGVVDVETVEVNVTNRPAKSNPVNMPVSSALLPVVIEGSSGSSLEQSPRLIDPYSDSETSILPNDFNIKESLADAMMEGCAINSRDTGGCQSLGSCDDISSSSFDSTSQHSIDIPLVPSFCIDATIPFPD